MSTTKARKRTQRAQQRVFQPAQLTVSRERILGWTDPQLQHALAVLNAATDKLTDELKQLNDAKTLLFAELNRRANRAQAIENSAPAGTPLVVNHG